MKQESLTSTSQLSGAVLAALIAIFLVGCAGASAKQVRQYTGDEPLPRPPVLLVYQFAVDPDDVVVDSFGPNFMRDQAPTSERLNKGRAVAYVLSEQMVVQLAERGISARRAMAYTDIPMNAILVKGQFVSIKEGDQMARLVVGFGAGGDTLRVHVQVYQMTETGLRRISEGEGEAHGRKTPGVAGPAAVAAGAGLVGGLVISSGMNLRSEVKGSMATNVNNLAEVFAERAVKFYVRQGWL